MKCVKQVAEMTAADWVVLDSVAVVGCEIAYVVYSPADTSASKSAPVTVADKDTAAGFGTAAVAVGKLLVFLVLASESW